MASRHNSSTESDPLLVNSDYSNKYPADYKVPGDASFPNSVFNMACSAIGGGVLAFPFAYSQTGLVSGLVLTVIMIAVMGYSQHLIACCTHETKASNYNELVTRMLGRKLGIACEIILVLYLLGAVIAFMTIIGELGYPIVSKYITTNWFFGSQKFIIVAFSVVIILPLCFLKKVNHLGPASAIAILPVILLSVLIVVDGAIALDKHETASISLSVWSLEFFTAFPLIVFAYQSHIQVPVIHAEQKNRTVKSMNWVLFFAMLIESVLYIGVGIFGYLQFGSITKGNIILNYPVGNIPMMVASVSLILHFTLATPINFFPARLALVSFFFRGKDAGDLSLPIYALVTIAMFVPCLVLAVLVPKIQIVFSVIGSTLGVAVVFVFPSLFSWYKEKRNIWFSVLAAILAVFIGTTGTAMTIKNLIHPH